MDGEGLSWREGEAAPAAGPAVPPPGLPAADPAAALDPPAPEAPPPAPPPPRRRRPPRLVPRLLVPVLLLLALPLLFLGQEITAPAWLRDRVEAEAGALLDGGSVAFGDLTLTVGRDLHPRVRLIDATLRDPEGRLLARVPELAATVSPRGLLVGRVLVQGLTVRGAEASVTRAEDGSVDLVVAARAARAGAPAREPNPGARRGLASLPDRFERLFERPALEALRRVELEGLVVNYDDAQAGRTWTLDGGRLTLDLSGGETHLAGELSLLSGRGFVTTATLDYRSPRESPEAAIRVTLTDVAAADIATQSPALAWLGVVDGPISMALRAGIGADGAPGPLHVALKVAGGAIRPEGGVEPVGFDSASAYLSYDPAARRLDLDRLAVDSDWGALEAEGRAWLVGGADGRPAGLVGQLRLPRAVLAPPGLLDAPLELADASVDLRLGLRPFSLQVVQAGAEDAGDGTRPGLGRIAGTARVAAPPEGWQVAVDLAVPEAGRDRLLALWPEAWRPALRGWLAQNLSAGTFEDARVALRRAPGAPLRLAATARFTGAAIRPLPSHPPIADAAGWLSWDTGALAVGLEAGRIAAPLGGTLDVAGSTLTMPAGGGDRPPARLGLRAEGPITAALSLLDLPPLAVLSASGLPPDLAEGAVRAGGTVDLRLGPMTPDEVRYAVDATLADVATDALVPGWRLEGDGLAVEATEAGIAIAGPVTLDGIAAEGRWSQSRDAPGASRVEATVTVTPEAVAALGVALPPGALSGATTGTLTVDLAAGEAPRFAFASDLAGLGMRLPELGWSKGAGRSGSFEVRGALGSPPVIDMLALDAAGLDAAGSVRLNRDGSLDRLTLPRVALGGWFEGPVTLVGRGAATPGIEVGGGTLDLRAATLGEGGSGGGEGGPVTVRLDRLQVTDGIALTGLQAELSTASGVEGTFSGRVNGGPAVTGRVTPVGDRVGARIQGDDAGAVLSAADIFTRATGGALDLLLIPVGEAAYDGEARVTGLRVVDAPVLASMLNAVSVVGLLQQLGGQGIVFDEVAADFRIDPSRLVVDQASAVGPGLGLSLNGLYDFASETVDFEGVLSPLYVLNGIGQIFSRPGEGLIGFNYSLRGPAADPQVGVNPLSALTPGGFRDLFRRPPPSR